MEPLFPPHCDECERTEKPSGLTRRVFLRSGALALVGVALSPTFLTRTALAEIAAPTSSRILVAIFQRGAADGLSMVVPFREPAYYRSRRLTAVAAPAGNSESAIDLDGKFALHPALAPFKSLYDAGHLAIVHASGSPDSSRSHFDAQDYMENGAPGNKGVSSGWLNRCLAVSKTRAINPFRAIAATPSLPRSLQGSEPALVIPDVHGFGVRGGPAVRQGFEGMYSVAQTNHPGDDAMVRSTGRESFKAVAELRQRLGTGVYAPANGAVYPAGPFGRQMQQVAQLIKADLGLQVACTDIGGWDTHANQGGARGQMANVMRQFAGAITAFYQDLGDRMQDVVLLTMSEFGRKVEENGSGGTDHGHASCNFVVGGRVAGGKVYTQWPGLEPPQLYEERDLAVTTDFRDVFGEIVIRHLGCARTAPIFPDYPMNPQRFRGFIA